MDFNLNKNKIEKNNSDASVSSYKILPAYIKENDTSSISTMISYNTNDNDYIKCIINYIETIIDYREKHNLPVIDKLKAILTLLK